MRGKGEDTGSHEPLLGDEACLEPPVLSCSGGGVSVLLGFHHVHLVPEVLWLQLLLPLGSASLLHGLLWEGVPWMRERLQKRAGSTLRLVILGAILEGTEFQGDTG